MKVGAEVARRGDEVVAVSASRGQHIKIADFLVNGKPTELKTISSAKASGAATTVTNTIKEATKQAKNIIIDARHQGGLTQAKARAAVQSAIHELPKSRIAEVRLFGHDAHGPFEILVKK